jgi:hypothetical protein
VVSQTKLDKGDATFSTTKRLLGWDVDTHYMTLALPPHWLQSITDLLQGYLTKHCTSKHRWRQLLGTLRSTTPALYGANHMFSLLQHAYTTAKGTRIRLMPLIKATLRDWLHLAATAAHYPVPIHTLVPRPPDVIAATDASATGMGGFWSTGTAHYLWRAPFPTAIRQALISAQHKTGTVTNSDLELAALITGSIMAARTDTRPHINLAIASDNTPAVAWATKGSTTTMAPPAYLLHTLATLRRATPFSLTPCFTAGDTNQLADCCSRLFALSDTDFLTVMNARFPIQPSWTLVTPPPAIVSAMNSALSRKLLPLESPPADRAPTIPLGPYGTTSASPSVRTPTLSTSTTQYLYSKFLPNDTVPVSWLPAGLKSALAQWKEPFVPWARRSLHWDSKIHACSPLANSTYASQDSFLPTKNKIHLPLE